MWSSPSRTVSPPVDVAYKYTIEPKYIGFHPLPATAFTVKYEVQGQPAAAR